MTDPWLLVSLARDGDKDAREALYRQFSGLAFATAARCTSNYHDQEDLVHEAFIRAFSSLDRLRDPRRFGPWLATITRFAAIDRVRREMRVVVTDVVPEKSLDADPFASAPNDLMWLESVLRNGLAQMSQKDADLLRMVAAGHAGPSHISAAFGISLGAAKVATYRARQRLRLTLATSMLSFGATACSTAPNTSTDALKGHVASCRVCMSVANEEFGYTLAAGHEES